MEGTCELCERERATTSHHLIPKKVHSKKWARGWFTKFEMNFRRADLCHDCHSEIHRYFTNKELAQKYNTVEKLLANELVMKFVIWVKKQDKKAKKGKLAKK